jgi:hypothetical protein
MESDETHSYKYCGGILSETILESKWVGEALLVQAALSRTAGCAVRPSKEIEL